MTILDAMKERRSVRSFNGLGLSQTQRDYLARAIGAASDPFDGKVTIRLKSIDINEDFKPSTYGVIKGARDFFLLGIGDDEASALSAGYRFEEVVLRAWEAGLGTCWIAATFKVSKFEKVETWPARQQLKIVSPVGVPARQTVMEKVMRLSIGADKRKPFDELFSENKFGEAVSPDNRFREALSMLRLAPSSTNSQPWRALVVGDTVHFYYKPRTFVTLIDCGIGLCHFIETERYYGREGQLAKLPNAPEALSGTKYLISYQSN